LIRGIIMMKMLGTKFRSVHLVCVLVGFVTPSALASDAPAAGVLTKKLDFPSPVQWKAQGIEISLIGVAWGPATSPEMIPRGREDLHDFRAKAEFYPDRPYVLALNFRARVPNAPATAIVGGSSGLGRIKNVDGDIEPPLELTQSGFVPFSGSPGVYDIRFNRNSTMEYWDFFPTSPDQTEFLFEVFPNSNYVAGGGTSQLAFKIIRKDNDFIIVNSFPVEKSCASFTRNFAGTMGSNVAVNWQLTRHNATVSGTEQYARVGTTLWLQGSADSLGNVVIEERYPKEVMTGVFKGTFASGCRMLSGFFSKPDGSRLQPFEFREAGAAGQHDANEPDPQQQ
jgi:hypothetical protein